MPIMRLPVQPARAPEPDLRKTYDAIVIGSGAAGGMAAFVLTQQGLEVLLLEAGRKLDINAELKSMEWPYDHPRRGDMPSKYHALSLNEYNIRTPPVCPGPAAGEGLLLRARVERVRLQQEHRRRREAASVHGHQLRVGSRALPGRQDQHLGPARPENGRSGLQGEVARRLRRRLADRIRGHRAVLRPGRSAAGHLGGRRAPAVSARLDLPAAVQAERTGGAAAQDAAGHGANRDALPRGRDHRRAGAQQVPQQVLRARRLQPARRRMRHPRGVRFADRPHLPGPGHRPSPHPHQRDGAGDHGRSGDREGARRGLRGHRDAARLRGARRARWSWPPRRSSRPACCCSPRRASIPRDWRIRAGTSATTSAST